MSSPILTALSVTQPCPWRPLNRGTQSSSKCLALGFQSLSRSRSLLRLTPVAVVKRQAVPEYLRPPLQDAVQRALSGVAAFLVAACTLLALPNVAPNQATPQLQGAVETWRTPDPASLRRNAQLFTDDGREARTRLERYAEYVDSVAELEEAPGCEMCRSNRVMLENTWEMVASEFYDPSGHFTQADWAQQLLSTLQGAGGVLRSRHDTYQALDAMLASLNDRYSQFLPPGKFRQTIHRPSPSERQYLAAQYVAAGVVLGAHAASGGWYVETPLAESPAEEAGVRRGDRIQTVDGASVDALSAADVAGLLRGPGGTQVELGLVDTLGTTRWVLLTRRELPQPPTRQMDLLAPGGGRVRYIRVHYFMEGRTAREVREAVEAGEREGVEGYVLDLRNNPGGSFEAAVSLAEYFLPQGAPITSTVRFGDVVDAEWRAGQGLTPGGAHTTPPLPLTSRPLVLLTNASTASASELLAGALRDNGRAEVIGERTFGKGVVQEYFGEPDGSGLKLTVAKYITPSGYDITRKGGLAPDLVCHDHPRGLTGRPDVCVARALHSIAGGWTP